MARYTRRSVRSRGATRSYGGSARRSYGRRAAPRRARRSAARTSGRRSGGQTVRLVIQQAPTPPLSSPTDMVAERAARVARF